MIKKTTPKKPWIKICGLTDPQNALDCAILGADAIGLVFFERSPRNISIKKAAQITQILPDHILTIGVFVDESYDTIMERVQACKLKGIQLHGDEPPELVDQLRKENLVVIKAFFANRSPFLNQTPAYETASFFLVEYGKGPLPGGNALPWDYEQSLQLHTHTPIVLAGGLDPANICQAIQATGPDGIDVSSGVEKSHGIKDLNKVKSFVSQVNSLF